MGLCWRGHSKLQQAIGGLQSTVGEVNRDTGDALRALTQQLTEMQQAVHQVRHEVTSARLDAQAARSAAEAAQKKAPAVCGVPERAAPPQPGVPAAPSPDGEAHGKLLTRAAGVAHVVLVCHRDTWDFVVKHASRGEHFRLPVNVCEVEQGSGVVEAVVSGRSLLAVAGQLYQVQRSAGSAETQCMAGEVYGRIGEALARAEPGAGDLVRIVIDDRQATVRGAPPGAGECCGDAAA